LLLRLRLQQWLELLQLVLLQLALAGMLQVRLLVAVSPMKQSLAV
jgi:hypothetical protein